MATSSAVAVGGGAAGATLACCSTYIKRIVTARPLRLTVVGWALRFERQQCACAQGLLRHVVHLDWRRLARQLMRSRQLAIILGSSLSSGRIEEIN
jgi:hypothetical protein